MHACVYICNNVIVITLFKYISSCLKFLTRKTDAYQGVVEFFFLFFCFCFCFLIHYVDTFRLFDSTFSIIIFYVGDQQ